MKTSPNQLFSPSECLWAYTHAHTHTIDHLSEGWDLTSSWVKQTSKTWRRQLYPPKVDHQVEQARQWYPKVFIVWGFKGHPHSSGWYSPRLDRPPRNTSWPGYFIPHPLRLHSLFTLHIWSLSSVDSRTPSLRQKMIISYQGNCTLLDVRMVLKNSKEMKGVMGSLMDKEIRRSYCTLAGPVERKECWDSLGRWP